MDRGNRRLMPTRDHVLPASRGGTVKIICCLTCNGLKADMMPDEWAGFMEANPGWWVLSRAEMRARRRLAGRLRGVLNVHGNYVRQGTPPLPPVIVPTELIWRSS